MNLTGIKRFGTFFSGGSQSIIPPIWLHGNDLASILLYRTTMDKKREAIFLRRDVFNGCVEKLDCWTLCRRYLPCR